MAELVSRPSMTSLSAKQDVDARDEPGMTMLDLEN
jgi:hypothetical protein